MNSDINLLQVKKTNTVLKLNKYKTLRFIAVSMLFLVSSFSIILFLLILFSPLPRYQQEEKAKLSEIANFHQKIAKLMFVNERLLSINKVIKERPPLSPLLQSFMDKTPTSAAITAVKIENKQITLDFQGRSLPDFERLLEKFKNQSGAGHKFAKVTLTNLYFNRKSNNYFMSLEMTLF